MNTGPRYSQLPDSVCSGEDMSGVFVGDIAVLFGGVYLDVGRDGSIAQDVDVHVLGLGGVGRSLAGMGPEVLQKIGLTRSNAVRRQVHVIVGQDSVNYGGVRFFFGADEVGFDLLDSLSVGLLTSGGGAGRGRRLALSEGGDGGEQDH